MALGLGQSKEIAFVLAKTRVSVWSPSVYTDFDVHHQRAAAALNQRRACVLLSGGRDCRSLIVFLG